MELLRALVAGVGVAVPIGGLMIAFRKERLTRFDITDAAHLRMEKTISQLDLDMTGFSQQLGAMAAENERRFVPRPEYERTLERIDRHLFDLAQKSRTGRGA